MKKKLKLKKRTIGQLSGDQVSKIVGGETVTCANTCPATCPETCPDTCGTCEDTCYICVGTTAGQGDTCDAYCPGEP